MDGFREWLSDNLRYIILIVGVLILLVLIVVGIRAISGIVGGSDNTQDQQTTNTTNSGNDSNQETETTSPTEEPVEPLEKDAYPEINTLINTYYEALGNKDIEGLKSVVDNFNTSEEIKIQNSQYIEGYNNVEVYTKKGLSEDTYVVFAKYNYLCSGIETPVPALSQLYVVKSGEEYKISQEAETNAQIQEYVSSIMDDQDVQALVNETQAAYASAQEADEDLKKFLESLGNASSQTLDASEGAMLTANDGCNVRSAPNGDADIIGQLAQGDQVKKLGEDGEWIQVEFGSETGYVYHTLLN